MTSSRHASTRSPLGVAVRIVTALLVALLAVPFAGWTTSATAGTPGVCDTNEGAGKVDLFEQNTREDESGEWINGNINEVKGPLHEGQFVPQRLTLIEMPDGENEFVIQSKLIENDLHAYDYIPGLGGSVPDWLTDAEELRAQDFAPTITNGTITNWDLTIEPMDGSDQWSTIKVTIDVDTAGEDVVVTWYPHIASELDWGPETGAGSINGSPYHNKLVSLNCDSSGSRDNQIMAGAIHYSLLTLIKDAQPNSAQDFHFSIEPGGAASSFDLDDDADATLPNSATFRVAPTTDYTLSELNIAAGWTLAAINCVDTGHNSSTVDLADGSAVVHTADETANSSLQGTTTCTFVNTQTSHLTLIKDVDHNDTGDDAEATDWTLTATGPVVLSGAGGADGDVPAGDYTLSETGPATYSPGTWSCTGGSLAGSVVTLAPGDSAVCRITNTAIPSPWEILKTAQVVGDPYDDPQHAMPGDTIRFTVTATKVGDGVDVFDVDVMDDLSDVLDDSELTAGPTVSNGTASLDGTTINWHIDQITTSVTMTYDVLIDANAWDATIRNVVTAPESDNCPEGSTDPDCTTTHVTPPVNTFVVKKVDFETGDALAGAKFVLWLDNGTTAGVKDAGDTSLGEKTTGADGTARWADLLAGDYLIEETAPPPGYALPPITISAFTLDMDRDYEASPFVVEDPSVGNLAIVAKRQYEKNANGVWVLSDGVIGYGEQVKYIVSVSATGTKLFHNVKVTDYVPGYNPTDTHVFGTGSTTKATLVPGSAKCTGNLDCTVTVSAAQLVTWSMGTVKNAAGDIEMIVVFPPAPDPVPFDANGNFQNSLWNVGFLDYDTAVSDLPGSRTTAGFARTTAALELVHTHLKSNEVIIKANLRKPPPGIVPCKVHCLPNTGSPNNLLEFGLLGGLVLLTGTALVARNRRRTA